MKEFFTRQNAEEGVKFPLYTPDGKQTEHWIRIRGVDSELFQVAKYQRDREAIEISRIEDVSEQAKRNLQARTKLLASLVIGWSFEQEATLPNVVNFLTEAPQIADAINIAAGERSRFFKMGQIGSVSGTEQG